MAMYSRNQDVTIPEFAASVSASSPGKTWSSGRQLTDAQRERKREINRATRRLQRSKKNADRIAHLELQLEQLKSRQAAEQEDLSHSAEAHSTSPEAVPAPHTSPSEAQTLLPHVASGNGTEMSTTIAPPLPERPYLMRDPTARDTVDMLNAGINFALCSDKAMISTDAAFNESVLAHAVLYGWAQSELTHNLVCPILIALRYLDENLFLYSGPMERLTMMHCISRQLLSRRFQEVNDRQAVWKWYRPRPSQEALPHDVIVDYFVWPGMRERLVFEGEFALANAFVLSFLHYYRFYWPSEDVRTAFDAVNPGTLVFSDELRNRLDDLQHWRMDMDFFLEYPDFADDVLPTQSIPSALHVWSLAKRIESSKRSRCKIRSQCKIPRRKSRRGHQESSRNRMAEDESFTSEDNDSRLAESETYRLPLCLRPQANSSTNWQEKGIFDDIVT